MKSHVNIQQRGGQVLFALLFVLFAVFLLSALTTETKFSAGKSLFAQPRFWPGVSVAGMLIFGLGHGLKSVKHRTDGTLPELLIWFRSIEYLIWFMAYVYIVPTIGYLLATLIFMALLVFRQGYRSKKAQLLALLVGFCVVLVFKTGLAVKIPGGAVYEYLPDALRNFMISNF